MSIKLPEIIFHYTSAEAFISILEQNRIRATNIDFFHDAKELIYARDELLEEVMKRINILSAAAEDDPEREEACISYNLGLIGKWLDELGGHQWNANPTYVTCFCEDSDLLSQWRAYGSGGYAIGFKAELLVENRPDLQLKKVTYGVNPPLREEIIAVLDAIGEKHEKGSQYSSIQFAQKILPLLAGIKHRAFSEEKEWRLIQKSWGSGFRTDNINFRSSEALGLVPYVEVGFPPEAIIKIIIGPGGERELKMNAIKWLLVKRGLETHTGYHPTANEIVEVEFSDAPLRG